MLNTVGCAGKCRRQVKALLAYTQMQVHTHNEQDCTLDKNGHTVAVSVQQCLHRLSMMHTICKTSRGAVCNGVREKVYSRCYEEVSQASYNRYTVHAYIQV